MLSRDIAASGKNQDDAIRERLAKLSETTKAIVEGVDLALKAPEKSRRWVYGALTREMERRAMLTGEPPAKEVCDARAALQVSFEVLTALSPAIRIRNRTLLETANGVERIEITLALEMKAVEECINRRDMTSDARLQLATFFEKPEAVDLMIAGASPELRVVAAEVALGIRSVKDGGAGLPTQDLRLLETCIGLAREATRADHGVSQVPDLPTPDAPSLDV